jgi:ABC-type glycerol-3-phosphate transport system substrate-binding protein
MPTTISGIRDLNYQFNGQFGEEVTFIGFPCEGRNGSVINANMNFVISKECKQIDGAWEFVRYFLTDEYQETIEWELPVNKEAFDKLAQKATERPYYMDGDQKVEYDEYIYINGEEFILPPMSQEQVDSIVAFIETVDKVSYYDEQVQAIIDEDAAPFFDGAKSAADAASVIQNRVQVYVNANR